MKPEDGGGLLSVSGGGWGSGCGGQRVVCMTNDQTGVGEWGGETSDPLVGLRVLAERRQ